MRLISSNVCFLGTDSDSKSVVIHCSTIRYNCLWLCRITVQINVKYFIQECARLYVRDNVCGGLPDEIIKS